jgi:hypothetical protein
MTNGKRKSSRLRDNFFIGQRFPARGAPGERRERELKCWQRGLFYAFNFGRDVRFVAVDCSKPDWVAEPYLTMAENRDFLEKEFRPTVTSLSPRCIVFGHHPPFCAGPSHGNGDSDIKRVRKHLWPLLRRVGVRVSFWRHEHNFQWFNGDAGDHYIVSGASGKAATDKTETPAHWAARKHRKSKPEWPDLRITACGGHYLSVAYSDGQMKVVPRGISHTEPSAAFDLPPTFSLDVTLNESGSGTSG